MYDLIVIGGGPAGLTAMVYAIRKRLNVLLISPDLGGKTNFHLELPDQEQYQVIRGAEVVDRFKSELEYLNFTRVMERVDRVTHDDGAFTVHTSSGSELDARAVIIATGARQQWLNVPGEREYLSRGLCYSAISYAPLFIGKKTVVIGDGDLALRAAGELATVAQHVHVVGPTSEVLKSPLGQKLQRSRNVTILKDHKVSRILGNGYCNRVIIRDQNGGEFDLHTDGAFVEMALQPNSQAVTELVDLDPQGRIKINSLNQTSKPGLFAAGDVTTICTEQVLVAVGEGAKAALSAYDYLLPQL